MRISIFDNQHAAVNELPEERQGAFWVAFFRYVFEGIEPEFEQPMERMAWNLVKPYIEKSITAGQNGKKGGRKPKSKTKPENQKGNQAKNQNGNQTPKAVLSENESEREGLGVSLKDTLNPSQAAQGAGGDGPAPSDGLEAFREQKALYDAGEADRMAKAARDTIEQRAITEQMVAEAVPCPAHIRAKMGGAA